MTTMMVGISSQLGLFALDKKPQEDEQTDLQLVQLGKMD